MRVLIVVAIVLTACLLFAVDRAVKAIRRGYRRRLIDERLTAVAEEVNEKEERLKAAKEQSSALTSVIPAIKDQDGGPRRVA